MAKAKSGGKARSRKKVRRKRHVQQQLFRRGGRRKGAGRKSKKARAGKRHERRPEFSARHPLHVVLSVTPEVGSLRRRAMYKAVREATISAAVHERIRIVHISLQRTHIHMLVEASGREALARGMQGFKIAAAREINKALGKELVRETDRSSTRGPDRCSAREADRSSTCEADRCSTCEADRCSACEAERCSRGDAGAGGKRRGRYPRRRGRVFTERYYCEVITTPTQAHRALRYVLNNWRRHGEDRMGLASTWLVDPFSSGILFPHWRELAEKAVMWPVREGYEPLFVYLPKTWLLADGWQRVGPISARDVPVGKC